MESFICWEFIVLYRRHSFKTMCWAFNVFIEGPRTLIWGNVLGIQCFNAIFVSSHMYPGNPERTRVIVGTSHMGYVSDTDRTQTRNLFHLKCGPIPLGRSDGQFCIEGVHSRKCVTITFLSIFKDYILSRTQWSKLKTNPLLVCCIVTITLGGAERFKVHSGGICAVGLQLPTVLRLWHRKYCIFYHNLLKHDRRYHFKCDRSFEKNIQGCTMTSREHLPCAKAPVYRPVHRSNRVSNHFLCRKPLFLAH